MVGGDVGYDCDVGTEIIYVVQLETADFQDIVVKMFSGDLVGVGLAYVASETYVEPGVL